MSIQVPVLVLIISIFILHTIATHLFNWTFRLLQDYEVGAITFLVLLMQIAEFVLAIWLMSIILK